MRVAGPWCTPPVCVASGESGFFASQVLVHKDLPDSPLSRQKVASRPKKVSANYAPTGNFR